MTDEKHNFDKEASSWDENPARVKLAGEIVDAIVKRITLTTGMDIMDFGCGTGLLSTRLLPFVRSVIGVDSSAGMLEIVKKKIAVMGLHGIFTSLIDIDKGDTLTGSYDLIVSSMTLHHIQNIRPLIDQFHTIISAGGRLCIADLDPDDGQFHADNTGVFHLGFNRDSLREIFTESGFDDIHDSTAAEVVKPSPNGEMRRFTIFLMTGTKPLHH